VSRMWHVTKEALQLQVSFAEEPNKRDDILQKRAIMFFNVANEGCHEVNEVCHKGRAYQWGMDGYDQ